MPLFSARSAFRATAAADNERMAVRLWSLLVWALVAASAVYWGLRLRTPPLAETPQVMAARAPEWPRLDLGRLAGIDAAPPARGAEVSVGAAAGDNWLQLMGVVSPPLRASDASGSALHRDDAADGLALISVGGKAPRAYAVGEVVSADQGLVLQAVSPRAAHLGSPGQPARLLLSIPAPAVAGATASAPPQR